VASVDVCINQLDAPNRLVLAAFAGDELIAATMIGRPDQLLRLAPTPQDRVS
jgi:hypothetical protein